MTPDRLVLVAPHQLRYGGRETIIAATVYLMLRELLACEGRLPVADLCRAVWRKDSVNMRTVWSLCHRANGKLAEVGHPARCGTDAGDVVFC